jgi:hypothetical protein
MDNKNNRLFYWNVKDFMDKKPVLTEQKKNSLKETISKVLNENTEYKRSSFVNDPNVTDKVRRQIELISEDTSRYLSKKDNKPTNSLSNPFYLSEATLAPKLKTLGSGIAAMSGLGNFSAFRKQGEVDWSTGEPTMEVDDETPPGAGSTPGADSTPAPSTPTPAPAPSSVDGAAPTPGAAPSNNPAMTGPAPGGVGGAPAPGGVGGGKKRFNPCDSDDLEDLADCARIAQREANIAVNKTFGLSGKKYENERIQRRGEAEEAKLRAREAQDAYDIAKRKYISGASGNTPAEIEQDRRDRLRRTQDVTYNVRNADKEKPIVWTTYNPVVGKDGKAELEPLISYQTDENGRVLRDKNGKPIGTPQYKKDEKGNIIKDENGNPIPLMVPKRQQGTTVTGTQSERSAQDQVKSELATEDRRLNYLRSRMTANEAKEFDRLVAEARAKGLPISTVINQLKKNPIFKAKYARDLNAW